MHREAPSISLHLNYSDTFKILFPFQIVGAVVLQQIEAAPGVQIDLVKPALFDTHVVADLDLTGAIAAKSAIIAAKLAAVKAKKVAALSLLTALKQKLTAVKTIKVAAVEPVVVPAPVPISKLKYFKTIVLRSIH